MQIMTVIQSNKDFILLRKSLNLEENEGDSFIIVSQEYENRPDLLSYHLYDIPDLWWVIYEFNGIHDPFFDLKAGTRLRIPELERVIEAINKIGEEA